MKIKAAFSACALVLWAVVAAAGQECPNVTTTSPDSVAAAQPITFTVNVSGGDENVTPTYNWTVSAGTIESGQGTATITVDTKGGISMVTATVDVGGYERNCLTGSSSTTSVASQAEARMYDSMMKNNSQDRLDDLAIELKSAPADKVYIIAYGGRRSYQGEAAASMKRAKDYLVKKGIDAGRIVTVDGGYREDAWRELWIVPDGAAPPIATPNVDPSEVIIEKPAPAKPAPAKKPVRKKS
jgi:hypothetical protein